MIDFCKGQFVQVGKAIGVIIFLENEDNVPEDHIGVWYGELSNEKTPKYKTVPKEYCELVYSIDSYH